MKQQNLPQQTHFIGVLTPEDITLTLEDCRRYMNEAYGCRSGHLTPIHVTLIPPFRLPDEYSTEDLVKAIEQDVLPAGVTKDAIEVMNELNIVETFPVNNITIFERKGSRWEAAVSLEI